MKREELITYLQTCMTENLNHARHVENERLTFTSIYVATTIGAVAAVFALSDRWVAFCVAAALFAFSVLAYFFNKRWQKVFDRHSEEAEKCQREWTKILSRPQDSDIGGDFSNNSATDPLGCKFLFSYEPESELFIHHTSKMFKVVYAVLIILMFLLAVFLHNRAVESPTGAGLYFSDSDSITLEAAIDYFIQKLQELLQK